MGSFVDREEKLDKISETFKDIKKLFKGKDKVLFEEFYNLFFKAAPYADIQSWQDEEMFNVANSLFEFTKECSKKQDYKVRIFNEPLNNKVWKPQRTVIEIVSKNVPFIVDSVSACLNRLGFHIYFINHPMMEIERNEKGELKKIGEFDVQSQREDSESLIHIQLNRRLAPSTLETLEKTICEVLENVMRATADWQPMLKKMRQACGEVQNASKHIVSKDVFSSTELDEATEFLDYLINNHFTFLGCREYSFEKDGSTVIEKGQGLGILRDDDFVIFEGYRDMKVFPEEVVRFRQNPSPIAVRKSTERSKVHRDVSMDVIFVKKYNKEGKVVGEFAFIGLFTSVVYSQSVLEVPFVRSKAKKVLAESKFKPQTHDYKALLDILEKYPRDEIFQATIEFLSETTIRILELKERQRVAVFLRRDSFQRFVTAMVYVPRDRFATPLRLKIQEVLQMMTGAICTDYYTTVSDSTLARVLYVLKTGPEGLRDFDPQQLEEKIAEIARSWADHLRGKLIEEHGEVKGAELSKKYKNSFSDAYQSVTATSSAYHDINKIEELLENGSITVDFYKKSRQLALKLYHKDSPIVLSDILPILENMGFRVVTEEPYHIRIIQNNQHVWLHDYRLECKEACITDVSEVKAQFEDAFLKVWHKQKADDRLNALVIEAGLDADKVDILRSYARYMRQATSLSRAFIKQTLTKYDGISKLFVDYFVNKFDPAVKDKTRKTKLKEIEKQLDEAYQDVETLNEDTILRNIHTLLEKTLRTNFYQRTIDEATGKEVRKDYISFKLKSDDIPFLPLPRPYREIYVYSQEMEGVHLRGGPIARGGLRWSDRFEDYRTEVLGLMKAQMVKNAVIVPVGSKGGFVCKNIPSTASRDQRQEAGISCYKTFISGLLDLTDNLVKGQVVPPENVVRYDDDDPYLVVAADKGTATFSDIANGKSGDYGFWLDDAFASGGSAGYDHKKMGITAKGAWECVKRHFREIGKNIQEEPFTVVGVGDMSGDVFGNGMLLSKQIKLLGAFNHLHIFCDPDPDPAKSWNERKRLFDLPRSTWMDYDQKLLSKGGAIFDRNAKSVDLTPEICQAFGIKKTKMTPDELIKEMLKAKSELLWFGGIGTYIKSVTENDADVGDRANDRLRVNGSDIQASVIGEGANLGVTQLGRIEYALKGGRLNADFIDNSGGVDCSDHEVNIKILLSDVMKSSNMNETDRNKLLEKMEDEVGELVKRNNYQQTQAISLSEMKSSHYVETHASLIREMEKAGLLNRDVENLPSEDEIKERMQIKKGLTRPELAILTSYSKIRLFNELLSGEFIDDKALYKNWLINYFPTDLRKKYEGKIIDHQLKRQIIATDLAGSIVNRMGFAYTKIKKDKMGASIDDVARAYVVIKEACNLNELWAAIEALDNKVKAQTQYELHIEITRFTDRLMGWFLNHSDYKKEGIDKTIKIYKEKISALKKHVCKLIPKAMKSEIDRYERQLIKKGVNKSLASEIAQFGVMSSAAQIIDLANTTKNDVLKVAEIYYEVGSSLGLNWLRLQAKKLKMDDYWQSMALNGMVDDLYDAQIDLTRDIIMKQDKLKDAKKVVSTWVDKQGMQVTQYNEHINALKRMNNLNLAHLVIADQKIRSLQG